MDKKPLVSIIIATYNRGKSINKAIESVLNQTYKDIEIIVIDDGSTDETPKIVSEISKTDSRIRIVTNKINLGLVKTLNRGISNAHGKYIARLDDDDFWCNPQKLEKQVAFLENNPDYVLVGGGVIRVDEQGKEIIRFTLPESDEDIRQKILQDNTFAHSTVVFKKEAWEKAGGYNETLIFSEDWDLWLRFGKFGKFYNFPEYFIYYLQGEQNISNLNIRQNLKFSIKLRKKYRKDYPGYRKAILFCWASYFYSFLPFKQKLWPIIFRIKRLI